MNDLTFTTVKKVHDIPRPQWDALFPADAIEGYDYFNLIDGSDLTGFSIYYAAVFQQGRAVCIAPFFITEFSFDTTLQGYFKQITLSVQKIFPGFLKINALFFGSPLTEEGIFGVAEDADMGQVLDFFIQEITRFCKDKKIRVITFLNLTGRDARVMDLLKHRRFGAMEAFPLARLEIKERSLEEYIQGLGKSTRKDVRRKLKKTQELTGIRIESRDSLNGILDQVYSLYLNNYDRGDVSFEKLTPEYFSRLSENMPSVARFFIVWLNDKIVGFNLCFVKGDFCTDKYIGFDYSVAHEYNLYYVTWCHNIDWCIKHGIRYYQPGTCDYDPKIRLGCKLVPLYVYSKFLNPIIHCLTAPVLKMISPKNFDPVLRNLHRYEKE